MLRRDAEANRSRLIAAAVDVFNDQGIDAGVEAIAERAGVGVGTLYRRFPNKEALIALLVTETIDDLTSAAIDAEAAPHGQGLEQFVRVVADRLAANRGWLPRLWNQNQADEAAIEQLRAHIDRLVGQARVARTVRADVTRTDVTAVIWSLQGVIEHAGEDAESACARLITIIFAGLAPQSART